MNPNCAACPVQNSETCIRWTTGHARLCELASESDVWRRLIIDRSSGNLNPVVGESTQSGPTSKQLAAILGCSSSERDCECLGKPRRCYRAGLPRIVYLPDCLACPVVTNPEPPQ